MTLLRLGASFHLELFYMQTSLQFLNLFRGQRRRRGMLRGGSHLVSEPDVYILEASSVSTDLSAPACILPEVNGFVRLRASLWIR